jgi:orotidine-5'-phosphate decarboxylase
MSVDLLQEKIRKTKNPAVVVFEAFPEWIPPRLLDECGVPQALETLYTELLFRMKGHVGAVRFGFGSFALLGAEGLSTLSRLLGEAKRQGYYVLLDAPETLSALAAKNAAASFAAQDTLYPCDGFVVSSYLGSDILSGYLPLCKQGKSLFVVVRTANRSAPEMQDLLSGGRIVHAVLADHVNRYGDGTEGKFGYTRVGILAAASSAESLRSLRAKYPKVFFLLDGFDYPNANAKNCSFAFDKFGHGAVACGGTAITAAWKQAESDGSDFLAHSLAAADRMKKNLTRYFTIL